MFGKLKPSEIENSFPFQFIKEKWKQPFGCFHLAFFFRLIKTQTKWCTFTTLSNEPELWFEPMQQHILIFTHSLFLISDYYFSVSRSALCFTVFGKPPSSSSSFHLLHLHFAFYYSSSICFLCIVSCSSLVLWAHLTKHTGNDKNNSWKALDYVAFNWAPSNNLMYHIFIYLFIYH